MPHDRLERSGLNRAWIEVDAAMLLGRHLDSLRCASTGLALELCSARWLALGYRAQGRDDRERGQAARCALQALARDLLPLRGSMSG